MTLRDGDREYFYDKLDTHFPGVKRRHMRAFGGSYECYSPYSPALMELLQSECRAHGIMCSPDEIFAYLHEFEDKQSGEQLQLF